MKGRELLRLIYSQLVFVFVRDTKQISTSFVNTSGSLKKKMRLLVCIGSVPTDACIVALIKARLFRIICWS